MFRHRRRGIRFDTYEDRVRNNLYVTEVHWNKLRNIQRTEAELINDLMIDQSATLGAAEAGGLKDVKRKMIALRKKLEEADRNAELAYRAIGDCYKYIK